MASTKKSTWSTWDKAWDLGLSATQRLEYLKECTSSKFTYSNQQAIITNDLDALEKLIETVLAASSNGMTVKHKGWWEHHDEAALQWDMVKVVDGKATDEVVLPGWSVGRYDGEGKLLSVTDFY